MAALFTAAPLFAQNSESGAGNGGAAGTLPTTATAVEVTESPTVDGHLDEAVWQQAGAMTDFTQREPFDGQPSSERTEVRVIFDDRALYVGVWAFDSQADAITYGERIRDYEVNQSDAVVFVLDTYNDDQNGFVFGTTPTGIEYDGQVANEGRGGGRFQGGGFNSRRRFQSGSGGGFNKNWDGSWTVATTVDDQGWYAEFRIPFSTLRYGNDTRRWGFNVSRRVRRLNEESFWTPVPREFNLYRLNYAGDLEGLRPPFRRFATATPYLLGSTARDYTNPGETGFGQNGDIGGEVKFQVTQGLTLDVTYNTDFAQVEVDDQQLNLTRFALNFPEKRPFFLENAGFFSVGGGGADLFFSRAIGIHQGQPVPIRGGARLSGRAAGLNVGLLHIETGGASELGADAHGFSVVRLARELPNRSRVGGLFINKSGPAGDFNRTQAVDASVRRGTGGHPRQLRRDHQRSRSRQQRIRLGRLRQPQHADLCHDGSGPGDRGGSSTRKWASCPAPDTATTSPTRCTGSIRSGFAKSGRTSRTTPTRAARAESMRAFRNRAFCTSIPTGSGTRERRSTPGSTSSPKASTTPLPSAAPT